MSRKSHTWNLFYMNSQLNEPWARLPWLGAVEEAKKLGVNLFSFHGGAILDSNGFVKQGNIIYEIAKGEKIDGLISWKGSFTEYLKEKEILEFMEGFGVPVVSVEGKAGTHPQITYGNFEGMKLIVEHVVKVHGHRKIGYLGLVPGHQGFMDRHEGFLEGMKEQGLVPDKNLIKPFLPWVPEVDGKPAEELLDRWLKECVENKVEMIIGACDPISEWAMKRLESMGYQVPGDMGLCGFDGFDEYQDIDIPLTTIDPDWIELGRTSVRKMVDLLDKKPVDSVTVVPPKQKVAKSCGCLDRQVDYLRNKGGSGVFSGKKGYQSEIEGLLEKIAPGKSRQSSSALVAAFKEEVNGANERFIRELDSALMKLTSNEASYYLWQDIISQLFFASSSLFSGKGKILRGHSLCQQARILITHALSRFKNRKTAAILEKKRLEREIGTELATTFSLDEMCAILVKGLEQLDIRSCFLYLYEDPQSYSFPDPCPEWSKLILAYQDFKRLGISEDQSRIKTYELIPDRYFTHHAPGSYGIYGLFHRNDQIGFIVFESESPDSETFAFISNQVASSLKGQTLLNQMDSHSKILSNGIEELSSAIEEIARNIEYLYSSINSQGTAVNQEASAIEEMRGNIKLISQMTEKSSQVSSELDSAALSGAESVKTLVLTIQQVQNKSNNILSLSNLIQEIADKTKLLAFNASVEAAHAGQKGAGFNIVAKEIRNLAEETESNIQGISKELNQLLSQIAESGTLADKAAVKLEIISNSARENSDLNSQLSLAMQEQEGGVNELLTTTGNLVNITSEINNAISEQMAVTNDFKDTLLKLRELV